MYTRSSIAIPAALGLLSLLVLPPQSSATCWSCAYGEGVGWYCYSIAGEGAAQCEPDWNEPCVLIGSATCGTDGCQCYRFPARKFAAGTSRPNLHTYTLGVLLLKGRESSVHTRLLTGLESVPRVVEAGDDLLTPRLAVRAVMELQPEVGVDDLVLAGYAAASRRGLAVARILGDDGKGVLVDVRGAGDLSHVRVSQLLKSSTVQASHDFDLSGDRVAVSKVSLGGESFACVVWAVRQEEPAGETSAPNSHRRFIEAASSFSAADFAKFSADHPKLESLDNSGNRVGPGWSWAPMTVYYR